MSASVRWFSRTAITLVGVIAALAAVWIYGRLTSPTAAQREALAVMAADAPTPRPPGENGFPLMLALEAFDAAMPASARCGVRGVPCL